MSRKPSSFDAFMKELEAETRASFSTGGRAVFVMKVLGGEPTAAERG